MSSVSDRMRLRQLAPAIESHSEARVGITRAESTLANLSPGQRATVIGYGNEVEASTARRLFDLGLVPGAEVTMVRRAPLRDPVIFHVGDFEIALRGAQSRCIYVEAVQ
ncbi:MAG: ferrous iron transport protein A [Mycobacterium sp.]|nr:ferrous iron transport protein A [Mycobacterium sp.]